MKFEVLTLFPAMFEGFLNESMIKRARERGLIFIDLHDIRKNSESKHNSADDSPFGGGPGMVMLAAPVIKTLDSIRKHGRSRTILLTPSGTPLVQSKVRELSGYEQLILVAGHYEGFDQRISPYIDEELSIGDYVLTGGELPAAVLIDSVSRYIPGVVKEMGSVELDSFSDGLLDYDHYTRPETFNGISVPEELTNGNHEKIRQWRRRNSLEKTLFKRPDILAGTVFTSQDMEMFKSIVLGLQS